MATLTIRVENPSILASLKKILKAMDGVEILPKSKTKKSGLEEALEDIRCGRVTEFDSSEDLFKKLGM